MNLLTKRFQLLLEALPSPYLEQEVLGVGGAAVVVQSPFHPERVVKLTSDRNSAAFLEFTATQRNTSRHLPRVFKVLEPLAANSHSPELFPVEMEKLRYVAPQRKGPQHALHQAWVKTVQFDKAARCIQPRHLPKALRTPDVLSAISTIEQFVAYNNSCFDGDTFSNCMFRLDGDWVLTDPITDNVFS